MRKSARGGGKKRVGGCPRFKMTSFSLFGCFKRHFKDASGEAPQEVKDVFARYAAVNGSLTTEKLLQFLEDVQGESNATLHNAKLLVEHQLGTIGSKLHHGVLDLESFFQLLLSPTLNAPLASNVSSLLYSCNNMLMSLPFSWSVPQPHFECFTCIKSELPPLLAIACTPSVSKQKLRFGKSMGLRYFSHF